MVRLRQQRSSSRDNRELRKSYLWLIEAKVCRTCSFFSSRENVFAGCTVAFGVRNLVNIRQGLAEIYRVLQPKGRLLILEFSRPTNPLFKPLYSCYLHHIMPCIAGSVCAENKKAYEYLAQSIASFYEPEELFAMMEEAGFSKVERTKLTFGIVSIYVGTK
ncbi:MAG: hypothetical protein D3910_21360 [Candidatus Electrothrix sp. ATG2]|nr:hypothetical protein [Candidatus Electrothrix sp. ATG2]